MTRRLTAVGAVLGVATLAGSLVASQALLRSSFEGDSPAWREALPGLAGIYVWAAFFPFLHGLSRRFPLGRGEGHRNIGPHALALVGTVTTFAAIYLLLDATVFHMMSWPKGPAFSIGQKYLRVLLWTAGFSILYHGVIVGTSHALTYDRMLRDRERRAARVEGELARMRLQALTMQLQPHFLFDTLQAVSALVNEEPRAANRMLTRLGDLLRLSLEHDGWHEISLQQELECLAPYLQIEQMRFRDRLTLRTAIAPEALDARVPSLILQPLVENAIRHGIAPRPGPGRIEIRAQRRDGVLELEVEDDGRGVAGRTGPEREGVGLRNTRARLLQLYGTGQRLELTAAPGGGTLVTLRIPYAPADRGDADGAADERP